MKLRLWREHYTYKKGGYWQPKQAFKTIEEARDEVGFINPVTYTCKVCGFIHLASYPKVNK